jgi:regulator of RNase E activity RraA
MNTTSTQTANLIDVATLTAGMVVRRWHNREGVVGEALTVETVEHDEYGTRVQYVGQAGITTGYVRGSVVASA